jgi:hypothetical protein
MVNVTLRNVLDLKTVTPAVESLVSLQKTSARVFWRSRTTPTPASNLKKIELTAYVLALWEHRPLSRVLPQESDGEDENHLRIRDDRSSQKHAGAGEKR